MKQDYISNGISKDIIISLLNDGCSVRQIKEKTGAVGSTIYKYAKEINVQHKGVQSKCEEYADRIVELVNEGYGYRQIAREIGIDRNNVRNWLRKNNIQVKQIVQTISQEDIAERVAEHGFKYVGGYVNHRSHITIYCEKCNTTFKRSASNLYRKYQFNIKCFNCMNVEAEKRKQKTKCIGKQTKHIKNLIEKCKKDKAKQRLLLIKGIAKKISQFHYCSSCGTKVYKYKYCGKCKKQRVVEERRKYYKTKEVRRRNKIESNLIDKDITVKKLYERDKGICYICNKQTDLNDYAVRNNTIICGGMYPSIDHIKPLSKGGEHSWKNVKLAHRQCNWEKSDKYTE